LATVLRLAGGLLVLPRALKVVPADEMGLWFIWGSLGGIAALADFGFASTIARAAAFYNAGGDAFLPHGMSPAAPDNTGPNWTRLASLVLGARKLYAILALSIAVLVPLLGFGFVFRQSNAHVITSEVMAAWWVFVAGVSFSLYGRWQSAFLNGVGKVTEVAQLTVLANIACLVAVVVALSLGGGLIALAAGQALPTFVLNIGLNRWIREYRRRGENTPAGKDVSVSVLWPTAWRTGVVMIGAYLTMNMNTLICARFLSLSESSGRFDH
jgi:hypothetical protein